LNLLHESDGKTAGVSDFVLVVDDHELVRNLIVQVLSAADIPTLEAASGEDALDLIRARKDAIGCIIQDMSMPGMSGPAIIAETLSIYPTAKILVLSVDDERTVLHRLKDLNIAGYLEKPCDSAELVEKVSALIA
jgi:DNA-binding NarL/FixJ family response regulator